MATLHSQECPAVQRNAIAKPRFVRALVVIDGSERTGRVIDYVLGLAQEGRSLDVVLLGVVPNPPDGRLRGYGSFKQDEIHARLKDNLGKRAVTAAARRFDQAGISHEDRIEVGDPTETIVHVAREEGCDLIVLGTAHLGAFQTWLLKVVRVSVARVAAEVVELAAMPVLVVK
jgi:nucleotide-binding universal stress UspA family protein